MPNVGDIAPDFELPNQRGEIIKLTNFRGKYVVLYFYPKDLHQDAHLKHKALEMSIMN